MAQLDQAEWETEFRGDLSDAASIHSLLEGVDQTVDHAGKGHRQGESLLLDIGCRGKY